MKVSIAGTGNVATIFAKQFKAKGIQIVEIIGRNEILGRALATDVNAQFVPWGEPINKNIDACIFAVSDTLIKNIYRDYKLQNIVAIHTSGAMPLDHLYNVGSNMAVLYPLQSLRKELTSVPDIPFLLEANNNTALDVVTNLAKSIGSTWQVMPSKQRVVMHTAAVIASNFTNHMYVMAHELCKTESIDFSLLHPLIVETATRLKYDTPKNLRTGPAFRRDIITMHEHLEVLRYYEEIKRLYTRMTDSIIKYDEGLQA
jgi:predicted short-subunit dehydrogenase-like oxidoreductase (DUF2520 family)